MSDWGSLNRFRVHLPGLPVTDASWGFNGAFRFSAPHEVRPVLAIACDQGGWQHVAVSFGPKATRCPSWEVMRYVKDLFWEPGETVIQIHPPASDSVRFHPKCLHLWRCTDGREQPLPPEIPVGFKGRSGE